MHSRVVYSHYHLTREEAIQRLEAARVILAATIDPILAAAANLEKQAAVKTDQAKEHLDQAEQLHHEAVQLSVVVLNLNDYAEANPAAAPAALAEAEQHKADAARLDTQAAEHKQHAEALIQAADTDLNRAAGGHTLAHDLEFNNTAIARRLSAARSSDEGAARALDQAAHMVLNAADWIDGHALLPATTELDHARNLARDARS